MQLDGALGDAEPLGDLAVALRVTQELRAGGRRVLILLDVCARVAQHVAGLVDELQQSRVARDLRRRHDGRALALADRDVLVEEGGDRVGHAR